MNEAELRSRVVAAAESALGRNERDGSHKAIIDTYNAIRPLPRGYKMTYTDPWCAAFISAVGSTCGLTEFILPECSCDVMIALYKKAGRWIENDSYTPAPGDIIMYDWQDSGYGDNIGGADHVGIVRTLNGDTITVVEGNISDAVGERKIKVNGKYIRGYCIPDYARAASNLNSHEDEPALQPEETSQIKMPEIGMGDVSPAVAALQGALHALGHDPVYIDGEFGERTQRALRAYQSKRGLAADGVCGEITWSALMKEVIGR